MPRAEIDCLESRVLFTGIVVQFAPATLDTANSTLFPQALVPIGSGNNFLFLDIKQDASHQSTLFGSFVNPSGVPGTQFPISTPSQQLQSFGQIAAVKDAQGNADVVLSSFPDLYFTQISPTGQVNVPVTQITHQASGSGASNPAIAIDPTTGKIGLAFVQSPSSISSQIYGGVLSSNGTFISPPFPLTPPQPGMGSGDLLGNPQIGLDPSTGRFDTVFSDEGLNSSFSNTFENIGGRQFTPDGTAIGTGPVTLFNNTNTNQVVSPPFLVIGPKTGPQILFGVNTFINNGGGSFTYSSSNITVVNAGDFNGDGIADIVASATAPAEFGVVGACPFLVSSGGPTDTGIFYLDGTHSGGNPSFLPTTLHSGGIAVDADGHAFFAADPDAIPFTNASDPVFPAFPNTPISGNSVPGLFLNTVTNTTVNSSTATAQPFTFTPVVTSPPVIFNPFTVTATAGHPATFTDGNGNTATLIVKGGGKAKVIGKTPRIIDINITGSDGKSIFQLNAQEKKTTSSPRIEITDITSTSPVGAFSAAAADVSGNISFKGITTLTLGSVADNHVIKLGAVSNAVVKFDHVATSTLSATGSIKSLTATDWTGGSISATSIASLLTTGNFDADVSVTTLGKLAVGAALGGTGNSDVRTIRAKQSIGAVSAATIAHEHIYAGVKPTIKTLPAARTAFNNPKATLTSITTHGFTDAIAAAPIVTKINIAGLVSTNATAFGITAERITNYKRDSVVARNVFSKKKIDIDDQYKAATV